MAGNKEEAVEAKPKSKGLWDDPDKLLGPRLGDAKNVSGSTAGAGSGDFHVYRAQRRKELARVADMETQAAAAAEAEAFQGNAKARREREEKRTAQRRRRREIKKKRRKIAARLPPKAVGGREDSESNDCGNGVASGTD